MKTSTQTAAIETTPTPAAAPAAAGFQTPHEQAQTTTPAAPKAKGKKAKAAKKKTAKAKPAKATKSKAVGRDAFGGRIGTRMSAINQCVIAAGSKGATVAETAEITKEGASLVGAQLGWMVSHKKVATRKEEKTADGKTTFRYFAKLG